MATLTIDTTAPIEPDHSWVGAAGNTYELYKIATTWSDAEAFAIDNGGYLAKVDSAAENKEIYNHVKTSIASDEYSNTVAQDGGESAYVWLGASDAVDEGVWKWSHNNTVLSSKNSTNTPWGKGAMGKEPDNYDGSQNYLALGLENWPQGSASGKGFGAAGSWNDLDGQNMLYFVVEKNSENIFDQYGGDVLSSYVIDNNLSSFDSNGVISTLTNPDGDYWSSDALDHSRSTNKLSFNSDKGSVLTKTITVKSTSSETESITYKAFSGETLNTSKVFSSNVSGTKETTSVKNTISYKEGASTTNKRDDITLSINQSSTDSTDYSKETYTSSSTDSISYSDGIGYKFSFKASEKKSTTDVITISDLSYSDANGNSFKFVGSYVHDMESGDTLNIKSLAIKTSTENIKLGSTSLKYFDVNSLLLPNDNDSDTTGYDFNGDQEGVGTVTHFMDIIGSNWIELYHGL